MDERDNIRLNNPAAMDEYKARQKNIARTREGLTNKKENLAFKKAEVEQLKVGAGRGGGPMACLAGAWRSGSPCTLWSYRFRPVVCRVDRAKLHTTI